LDTLIVFAADVGDSVAAKTAASRSLVVDGPFAAALKRASPTENLAWRAADAIRRARPGATEVALTVTKRIPVAAGLGGGSADAAATLRLLNQRWALNLDPGRLAEIGGPLGADVPMCLSCLPLLARGIGEKLSPVAAMPALPLVLVCPPAIVRTADVFAALTPMPRTSLPPLPPFETPRDVATWLAGTRNDLADPAASVSPAAAAGATALRATAECLFARMTGSGAAAFGLFPSRESAERAAAGLAAAQPSWWVTATTTGGS
jgi:4-diphosphocytidyl-2-C-methyl-D-erythritol kinase